MKYVVAILSMRLQSPNACTLVSGHLFGFHAETIHLTGNFVTIFDFQFAKVAWLNIWKRTIHVRDAIMSYINHIRYSISVLIERCKTLFTNWFQICKEVSLTRMYVFTNIFIKRFFTQQTK